MELAYVTAFDARDVKKWSGTGYYIGQSLQYQSISLEYLGPLNKSLATRAVTKWKRHYYELSHKRYLTDPEPLINKEFASQVAKKLSKTKTDIIFSATTNPIAYLETNQPIAFWADATFANMIDFYPHYTNLCQETIRDGHLMEANALQRCKLAIYSSEWAAQKAIEYYKADPKKVKVVPFGANIESKRTLAEIKELIENRPSHKCKLLFLGVDWFRKGGSIALDVAKKLNQLGLSTELTVVGCEPIVDEPLPSFVKALGYISKSSNEGRAKIYDLIKDSHFLILPSLADCTPIVISEVNSLGVPCISTNVGGIPTIIKNNLNGRIFNNDSDTSEYCKYISDLFSNYSDYKSLAFSTFHEYESRLNWSVAGRAIKSLLMEIEG